MGIVLSDRHNYDFMTGHRHFSFWAEDGVLHAEAVDFHHNPQLRAFVAWDGNSGHRVSGSRLEAWTNEKGWVEIARDRGNSLILSSDTVACDTEADWFAAATADLEQLLDHGHTFFAKK